MKKIISLLVVCLLCVSLVACGKSSIPTEVLDENLSNIRYESNPFSITIAKLVNSAMDGYKIKYLTCDEAIAEGYLNEDEIDAEVNRDKFYFAIISGETMVNPSIPNMTEHEDEAVIAWMIFDDNDKMVNSGVDLCNNLQTCAIILMTSSY
ncbi:MAG: hypothetical protein IKK55_02575 [Clostridia bacterium]|nr:hypothetical protein [Clostridia bacterium]MBR6741149.1 hypothetical protein [Clostridia bacterium]